MSFPYKHLVKGISGGLLLLTFLILSLQVAGQQLTPVSGIVRDSVSGANLTGVTVMEVGTSRGMTTDVKYPFRMQPDYKMSGCQPVTKR